MVVNHNRVGRCSICGKTKLIKCIGTGECGGCYARRRYRLVAKVGKSWWSDVGDITYKKIINNLKDMGCDKAADILESGIKRKEVGYNWGFQRLEIPMKVNEVLEDDGIVEPEEKYTEHVKPKFLPDWDEENYAYEILNKQNEIEE